MDEDIESIEQTTPQEVLAAGGVSQSRRTASVGRYGSRRSPTTGHRIRRNKSPEPYAEIENEPSETKKEVTIRRSHSSPGEIVRALHAEQTSPRLAQRRISSTSEEEETEKPVVKNESVKRLSGISTGSAASNEDSQAPKRPIRRRSKSSRRDSEDSTSDSKADGNGTAWWKPWAGWGTRGKSLEREPGAPQPVAVPRKRNRSLERPPTPSTAAAAKHQPPVIVRRNKSKSRTTENRRSGSTEDSSDDFWKPVGELRKRKTEDVKTVEKPKEVIKPKEVVKPKDIVKPKEIVEKKEAVKVAKEKTIVKRPDKLLYKDSDKEDEDEKEMEKEIKAPWRTFLFESRSQWKLFVKQHPKEVDKLRNMRNRCIASFVLLLIYCGLGGMVFRFTEGAFESFYKCGVKRVKRDFIDTLWLGSHNLREDDWKSLARRKLMDFEDQLHTAYEAGMTTYSGQRAWSFLNSVIYCLTVVTTIGYGHISPSTTTGRAITIVYAIFGIPMFLILLADFGKLFTRGIKFIWAFVRRVYYTGSCRKVRRTVPVQEVMKGVQMVYDIATFRRPSQMPPGLDLTNAAATEDGIQPQMPPPPQPPRTAPFTPMEPPGTPAMSTFSIDDEFNLPISVAITILLIYIFCGATVFYIWEKWGFFESFYFVFISMSTIGFGDFVPQNQMYMMASIVYLVFGLALTSMCINVVQEKLSDTFRQASAKIGATIGLRVAEEDGTVTPVAPAPVEVAEVHKPSKIPAQIPSSMS